MQRHRYVYSVHDARPSDAAACVPVGRTSLSSIYYRPNASSEQDSSSPSRLLIQQLLGLIDLCREIRATASIRMVQQHNRPVGLADFVLGDGPLTAHHLAPALHAKAVDQLT